jgi:hypothetical protein
MKTSHGAHGVFKREGIKNHGGHGVLIYIRED